jgi:hypothetical protein
LERKIPTLFQFLIQDEPKMALFETPTENDFLAKLGTAENLDDLKLPLLLSSQALFDKMIFKTKVLLPWNAIGRMLQPLADPLHALANSDNAPCGLDSNDCHLFQVFNPLLLSNSFFEEDDFIENPFQVEEGVLECYKCGSKRTISYTKQTRSADEPASVIATCINCKNKWVYSG